MPRLFFMKLLIFNYCNALFSLLDMFSTFMELFNLSFQMLTCLNFSNLNVT